MIGNDYETISELKKLYNWPFEIFHNYNDGTINIDFTYKDEEGTVRNYTLLPEQILGSIITHILGITNKYQESFKKQNLYNAVISVPNYFGYKKKQKLAQACILYGNLNIKKFITHSRAAVLSHRFKFDETCESEKYVIV